jgi:hypothetical protein
LPRCPQGHAGANAGLFRLEIAILDEWVRYWYKGELLPLPAEMQRELDEAKRRTKDLEEQLQAEREARQAAEEELVRLRAAMQQPRRSGS